MADLSEFGGTRTGVKSPGIDLSEFGGVRKRLFGPGVSPETAIDEQAPDISFTDRLKVMNLSGGDPAIAMRYLRDKLGLQAEQLPEGGYNIAVRSKKDRRWYKLESSRPELADVSDILGGALTGTAGVLTGLPSAAAGAVAGAVTGGPLGAVAGGIGLGAAGAAAGGGAAEAGLVGLGKILGMAPSPGEAARAVGREALVQGVGQAAYPAASLALRGAGKVLAPLKQAAGKALQAPEKLYQRFTGEAAHKAFGKKVAQEATTAEGLARERQALKVEALRQKRQKISDAEKIRKKKVLELERFDLENAVLRHRVVREALSRERSQLPPRRRTRAMETLIGATLGGAGGGMAGAGLGTVLGFVRGGRFAIRGMGAVGRWLSGQTPDGLISKAIQSASRPVQEAIRRILARKGTSELGLKSASVLFLSNPAIRAWIESMALKELQPTE